MNKKLPQMLRESPIKYKAKDGRLCIPEHDVRMCLYYGQTLNTKTLQTCTKKRRPLRVRLINQIEDYLSTMRCLRSLWQDFFRDTEDHSHEHHRWR